MTKRQKTLNAVKMLLEKRGYVVLGTRRDSGPQLQRYNIGEDVIFVCGEIMDEPFTVTAFTDSRDWLEQCKLVGLSEEKSRQTMNEGIYYRVIPTVLFGE